MSDCVFSAIQKFFQSQEFTMRMTLDDFVCLSSALLAIVGCISYTCIFVINNFSLCRKISCVELEKK